MNGEGLQHEDGHSHLLASVVPTVHAYDPAFAYEMATIIEHGIHDMFGAECRGLRLLPDPLQRELSDAGDAGAGRRRGDAGCCRCDHQRRDPAWHLPLCGARIRIRIAAGAGAVAAGAGAGAGAALAGESGGVGDESGDGGRSATILFSGTLWQAAMQARDMLSSDWGVAAEAWSVTSYKALREDALEVERWNRLHPGSAPRLPYVTRALQEARGPIVAVTDFLKAIPDQIARFVAAPFTPLGTDGFGRSDTRAALRSHFEVDAAEIVIAVLSGLASAGQAKASEVAAAIEKYGVDAEAPDPRIA